MTTPELSRRAGAALGTHVVTPDERAAVVSAVEDAETWDDLPAGIKALIEDIEQRPPTLEATPYVPKLSAKIDVQIADSGISPSGSAAATPLTAADGFDPSQPRDRIGRWVDVTPGVDDLQRILDSLPEGDDIYYHGTRGKIEDLDREVFITPSKAAALGYLEGGSGRVYAIRLAEDARIADESDMRAAADELWGSAENHFGYEPYDYELADNAEIRGELARAGFAGATFVDLGPDNAYEHETIAVWDGSSLGVETDVAVPQHDRSDVDELGPLARRRAP